MERFVERFRYKATKARQAQSRVKRLEKMERIERDPADTRSLGFSFGARRTHRAGGAGAEDGRLEVPGRTLAGRRRALDRARRARLPCWPQRRRQDHPDRGARRAARARRRPAAHRPQRQARLSDPARRRARHARHRARGRAARHRPHAEQGARTARPLPVLGRGGREADGGALRRRAAPALARRAGGLRRERPDPRRAHQPPRPRRARGTRGRAAGLRRSRAARFARPSAARRGRQPHGRLRGRPRCAATRAAGPSTRACARSAERRPRRPGLPPSRNAGPRPGTSGASSPRGTAPPGSREPGRPRTQQRRIAELEREVERAETALKALEDELADPAMWSSPSRTERNTARHAKARRAVEEAYARWEQASSRRHDFVIQPPITTKPSQSSSGATATTIAP